jgi:hypothetical protein
MFLINALQYASEKTGINYNKLNEYIKTYSTDKRYKIFILACTCVNNWRQSGVVKYKNQSFYYTQENKTITLEKRYR